MLGFPCMQRILVCMPGTLQRIGPSSQTSEEICCSTLNIWRVQSTDFPGTENGFSSDPTHESCFMEFLWPTCTLYIIYSLYLVLCSKMAKAGATSADPRQWAKWASAILEQSFFVSEKVLDCFWPLKLNTCLGFICECVLLFFFFLEIMNSTKISQRRKEGRGVKGRREKEKSRGFKIMENIWNFVHCQ